MVTTPAFVRAACWLFSAGAHVAVLVAAEHSPRPSATAQGDLSDALAIETTPEPTPEVSDPSVAPADTRSGSLVPRETHRYPTPMGREAHSHEPALPHIPPAAPSPTFQETMAAAPARFTMVVNSDDRRGPPVQAGPMARRLEDPEPGSDAAPLAEEGVSRSARLATSMSPAYPAEARAQEIEADVVLAIVVASTGEVIDARVLKAAGYGFDQEALRAVRVAHFFPAERDGRRVAVRMRWSVSFRLR